MPFLSSSRSAAAISGNINSVLDDFLDDVGNLEADLHLAPFGCRSHKHLTQNANWHEIREHCAHCSVGFTRDGEVQRGQD